MDDEFKLCWKNFQDNIASGFQNLYDRGDLVDVTLACDGKLLQAHKIVLAICSPYFQEIFTTNPCQHPISEYSHPRPSPAIHAATIGMFPSYVFAINFIYPKCSRDGGNGVGFHDEPTKLPYTFVNFVLTVLVR